MSQPFSPPGTPAAIVSRKQYGDGMFVQDRTSTPGRSRAQLKVVGKIGNPQIAALDDRVQQLIAQGLRYLVIDLAGVDRCTGRLVTLLARTDERLRARGGELRLAGLGAEVIGVLPSASLPEIFTVYRAARPVPDQRRPGLS